jgi:hypothetical protein
VAGSEARTTAQLGVGIMATKDEQLIDVWKRLIRSMADKEGITVNQAETRAKTFFPELYELYDKARQQREG